MKSTAVAIHLALLTLTTPGFGQQEAGADWTKIRSSLRSNFYSAVWTGKEYLAVGEEGIIYSSNDGSEWNRTVYGPNDAILQMRIFNGKYYATGMKGIHVSPDGLNWHNALSSSVPIYDIAMSTDAFIAVGDSGKIYESIDGENWIPIQSSTVNRLCSVAYALGAFYIAGNNVMLKSTNRRDWQEVYRNTGTIIYSIASNGTTIMIAGRMDPAYSSDSGKTWSDIKGDWADIQNRAIWDGKQYIVASWDGSINYLTSDSTSVRVLTPSSGDLKALATNGKNYIAIGLSGISAYTSNLSEWETGYPIQSAISYANNKWFTISDRYSYYISSNGLSWKRIPNPENRIQKVINNGGAFLAIGKSGSIYNSSTNATIYSSVDGERWEIDTMLAGIELYDIINYNNVFFAVGTSGLIVKSSDGKHWEEVRKGGRNAFYKIFSASNMLFAACSDSLLTSTNGKDWVPAKIEVYYGAWVNSLVYTGSKYIASSGNGIHISLDGISWNKQNPSRSAYDLQWNGTEVIAYLPSDNSISRSYDGIDWIKVYGGLSPDMHYIGSSKTTMIAVSRNGAIYISPGSFSTKIAQRVNAKAIKNKAFLINGSKAINRRKHKSLSLPMF